MVRNGQKDRKKIDATSCKDWLISKKGGEKGLGGVARFRNVTKGGSDPVHLLVAKSLLVECPGSERKQKPQGEHSQEAGRSRFPPMDGRSPPTGWTQLYCSRGSPIAQLSFKGFSGGMSVGEVERRGKAPPKGSSSPLRYACRSRLSHSGGQPAQIWTCSHLVESRSPYP